jgi:uncharacterized protein (DUF2164 family)
MTKLEDKIKQEVFDLVATGQRILARAQSLSNDMKGDELAETTAWVTRLGQVIRKLYGENSQPFACYSQALATNLFYVINSNWNAHISQLVGVTKTIQHDLEHGLIFDFRGIVQADIFADFLEMGEYLLNEGYKDAAAVLIGAVLEDGLRKLCEKNGLPIVNSTGNPLTIEPMNAALAKEEVYNKLVQKQVTTWAHVRNKAAHGEYSEYNKEQVQMMLVFVQSFSSDYLG